MSDVGGLVTEYAPRAHQFGAGNLPGNSHTASTSSRTK
jgi:hypothetical protein